MSGAQAASAGPLPPPAVPSEHVPARLWIAIYSAIFGVFMAVLDTQITNASLANILGSLSASQQEGSWVTTSYLAAEVVMIPLTTFLLTVFGMRAFILGNMVLFLVFSTMCGYAWNLPSMVVFRTLQGLAGGALIPVAMTLLITRLPPAKRPVAFAWLMLSSTLAPTLGPTLGGMLTDAYGWPSIFFINWLPGIVMFAGVAYGLDPEPSRLSQLAKADWPSIIAMVVGLGALVVFLEQGEREDWFASSLIRWMATLAALGLGAWIAILLARRNPFINLRLFGRLNFGVSSLVGAAAGMGLYGSTYVLPLFLANIAGYSPRQIGGVIMWMGLPQIIMTPLAAKLAAKVDNRVLCSIGLAFFATSCFLNTTMSADTREAELILAQVCRALGQPLIIITLSNFAVHRIEAASLSSASSLYNMSRVLGGAVGTAILATMVTQREHLHSLRIGDAVSLGSGATSARIQELTAFYLGQHGDRVTAANQALATLDGLVRRESYVMAYNDCFFLLGCILLISIAVICMADRVVAVGKK
jgi:MFS transporter, DHA2 family, multidrug resistance protein